MFLAVQGANNFFHFLEISLTEQSVRFIHNKETNLLHLVNQARSSAQNLPHTTWCSNNNISSGKLSLLLLNRQSACQQCNSCICIRGILDQVSDVLAQLNSQLSSW